MNWSERRVFPALFFGTRVEVCATRVVFGNIGMENGQKRSIILIYTGDHDLAKSLTLLLQDQYKVHTTSILRKATDAVERREADLFIADFGLSLETGLKALEQLREKNTETPVIVFCSYQLKDSKIEREIRDRVDFYFHVPVNVEEIVQAITNLLTIQDKKADRKLVHTHT
jgi:two-component system cell cycle response regulator DivK